MVCRFIQTFRRNPLNAIKRELRNKIMYFECAQIAALRETEPFKKE